MLTDMETIVMTIGLAKAPTARDEQTTIGASNLSNGCEFCLASNLIGDMRETSITDRAWGGRVFGTALHALLEHRAKTAKLFKQQYPDALIEHRMMLGEFPGYHGPIGTTADLILPSEQHAFDWKTTTDEKSAIMLDYIALSKGLEAPFGRGSKYVLDYTEIKPGVFRKVSDSLSETKYAEKLAGAAYKMAGYYAQLQLYGLVLNRNGIPVQRLTNVYVSRNSTMWFDNPNAEDFTNPNRMHGIWVLSFDYDQAAAEAQWDRGLGIWLALQAGASVDDFERHQHCFPCSIELQSAVKEAPFVAVTTNRELVSA